MLFPGLAHGRSYTQLNDTYQGQIGDREGELERGIAGVWREHGQAETEDGQHRWKETGGGGAR